LEVSPCAEWRSGSDSENAAVHLSSVLTHGVIHPLTNDDA